MNILMPACRYFSREELLLALKIFSTLGHTAKCFSKEICQLTTFTSSALEFHWPSISVDAGSWSFYFEKLYVLVWGKWYLFDNLPSSQWNSLINP